eukprot:scaffold102110_cov39-Phaeocystis_antarctica.AAC.2
MRGEVRAGGHTMRGEVRAGRREGVGIGLGLAHLPCEECVDETHREYLHREVEVRVGVERV